MNKNTKGIIAIVSTLGLIGVAYYFLIYKKSDKVQDESNFYDFMKNLGLGHLKTTKDAHSVDFNSGKNTLTIFKNNRFATFKKGEKGLLKKGTYTNGGKKLFVDGGNVIEGELVWENISKTL